MTESREKQLPTLWIIATPIGNLEDLTPRAARLFHELTVIACEDTRHTGLLLKRINAKPILIRYDEHSHDRALKRILLHLQNMVDVGLVCDAGTPGMSDPGMRLVAEIAGQGYPISPIPGPSALIAALSISGFIGNQFHFAGFLPSRGSARAALLKALSREDNIIVLYESPLRIQQTLGDLALTLGNRRVVVCRELTKLHESVYRFLLSDSTAIASLPAKGEYVVVVGEKAKSASKKEINQAELTAALEWARKMISSGHPRRLAAHQAAKKFNLSANLIYRNLIPSS